MGRITTWICDRCGATKEEPEGSPPWWFSVAICATAPEMHIFHNEHYCSKKCLEEGLLGFIDDVVEEAKEKASKALTRFLEREDVNPISGNLVSARGK